MRKSTDNILLVFIKNPVAGKVKTRLARSMGDQRALEVYQQLLSHTRAVARQVRCHRQLWYSSFIGEGDEWSADSFEKKLQEGNDLGQRMSYAFQQAFRKGAKRVVIIGSDCAELQKSHLEEAFAALADHEVVIGPSRDGGYYLLGMNSYYPDLFNGIEWSTASVFAETMSTVEAMELKYHTLPVLNDIDTEEDFRQSGQQLQDL